LAAVAFDTPLGFERRLRALPRQPITVEADPHLGSEQVPSNAQIESWELHSEFALVCPEVRKRARQLLPEHDPHAFLNIRRAPIAPMSNTADEAPYPQSLPLAIVGYTLSRVADTARTAFLALATVVVLALLAQLLH
jgi:hypothetical protein